jgi:hypothetical protein
MSKQVNTMKAVLISRFDMGDSWAEYIARNVEKQTASSELAMYIVERLSVTDIIKSFLWDLSFEGYAFWYDAFRRVVNDDETICEKQR